MKATQRFALALIGAIGLFTAAVPARQAAMTPAEMQRRWTKAFEAQ